MRGMECRRNWLLIIKALRKAEVDREEGTVVDEEEEEEEGEGVPVVKVDLLLELSLIPQVLISAIRNKTRLALPTTTANEDTTKRWLKPTHLDSKLVTLLYPSFSISSKSS